MHASRPLGSGAASRPAIINAGGHRRSTVINTQRRFLRKLSSLLRNIYVQAVLALLLALQLYQFFITYEHHLRDRTRALSHRVAEHLPSMLGLWTINKPRGQFNPLFPTSEEIIEEAKQILPVVNMLMEKKFFRIFKVDLDKECPFWARKDLCSASAGFCSVCECTEDQIPLPWKEKPIEHFVDRKFYEKEEVSPWVRSTPFTGLPGPAGEAEDDFLASLSGTDQGGKSTYVDLSLNPPCFTAFKGRNVWSLIYKENCLSVGMEDNSVDRAESLRDASAAGSTEVCSEEEFFVKMISGLQTAIMVLSSEYNKPFERVWPLPLSAPSRTLKTRTDRSSPPRHWYSLDLFRRRVAWNREWIENLYVDFSLLVRTVMKVRGIIESCDCYTGTEIEDQQSRVDLERLLQIVSKLPSANPQRLQQPLFERKHELALRQFTNISRILDCVECEKCRLHGKVKITALQVALKGCGAGPSTISADGATPLVLQSLERNEITALINTLGYLADAVLIIERFERRTKTIRAILITAGGFLVVFLSSYLSRKTNLFGLKAGGGKPTYSDGAISTDGINLDPILCMLNETTSTAISSSNSASTPNGTTADEFVKPATGGGGGKKKRKKRI